MRRASVPATARLPIALAVVALVATATVAAAARAADRIIFPHPVHAANGVECETCHAGAASSRSARDSLLPAMDVCGSCHDIADEAGCATCHTDVASAGAATRPAYAAQRFSHAAHQGKSVACAACHGDAAVAPPRLPAKPDCRVCHATADDYGDCRLCHDDGEALRPFSHDGLWAQRHGAEARAGQASCADCHTQAGCAQCHAGDNVRPRVHPLNFEFDHGVKARANDTECAACHGEPEFCSSCHAARHVLPDSHSRAGWVRFPDGGRHAVDGALEIESCIACHSEGRDAPTCAACHGE